MATIYISPTGSATAAGTEAAPKNFAAIRSARAGDVVIALPGTYTGVADAGRPDRMVIMPPGVTLRSSQPRAAKLLPANYVYAIVELQSGCTVDGFEMGSNRNHNHGVFANRVSRIAALNNKSYGGSESGVGTMNCDFVRIEGNECYGCAHSTWGSGISIYHPIAVPLLPGETEPDYRLIIRNNISRNNVTDPNPDFRHTDGNGIILDDFQHTQDSNQNYGKRCLVENNLLYQNGGKGIACHWCTDVTIRRNTCIGNNLDNTPDPMFGANVWRGELSQQDGARNRWEANLAVPNKTANTANSGIGYYGNLGSGNQWIGNACTDAGPNMGGASGSLPGSGNLFNVNPQLVNNVPTNTALANIGWRPNGVAPVPLPEPEPMPTAPNDLSPFDAMTPASGDIITEADVYELGTKIRIDRAGTITGLRVYRVNTVDQTIRLWKGTAKVAEGVIPGGANGWQQFAVNVPAVAGDQFVVSVGKTSGMKYASSDALGSAVVGDGFTIPALGGVFSTTIGQLPTQVFQQSYYWTGIRFAETVVAPPPDPETDLEAEITAIRADLAALTARVVALEGVPSDYGPRIIALTERVTTAEAGLTDLDRRLDGISSAAGD